ncbi:MAG: response regulator transcription factor [Treponema sp.]|jgi:NarL family two-component system response regulator LiaR|nr:response regulator transcription factor [Treponema sp.]
MINILISSWHDMDREHILAILSDQNDFRIAGVEKDEVAAIMESEKLKPDILILDIPKPIISCPELAPIIHRRSPDTGIIMLSDIDEENFACLALKAGILGFLLKKTDMNKLTLAVKNVHNGEVYMNDSIIHRVFDAFTMMNRQNEQTDELIFYEQSFPPQTSANDRGKYYSFFSPTERGIITFIAKGFNDEQIADSLHLSTGAIRNCITKIRRKTNFKSRAQIVVFSIYYGLISFEKPDFPFVIRQDFRK